MKIVENYFSLILIGIISFFIIFISHYFGLFSSIENKMYDFRFKVRGPLIGWDSNSSKSKYPENYNDVNNNNIYDIGESFTDIGNQTKNNNEQFEDLNQNNIWDNGEPFIDLGNNLRDSGQNIVIVEIDDEAYRLIPEGYPYTRGKIWSEIIYNLTKANAKTIVFDIMFDSPDHTTQIINSALQNDCSNCIYEDPDILFSNSIQYAEENGTSIVLASKLAYDAKRVPPYYYVGPYHELLKGNPSIGLVDQEADLSDNIIRRYPIFYKINNDSKLYLSLAVQTLLSYKNINDYKIRQDVKNSKFYFNDFNISTYGEEASFLINYYGPPSNSYQTFDTFSLSNIIDTYDYNLSILEEDDDWMDKYINKNNILYPFFGDAKNPFKDKIVIIGSSLAEDNDFISTPYFNYKNSENPMPGVEVHANAIQQLLHSDFIHVPTSTLSYSSSSSLYHIIIIIFFVLLTMFISNINSLILSILLNLCSIISWFSISIGFFIGDQLWIVKYLINFFSNIALQINAPVPNHAILLPVSLPIISVFITFGINLSYKLFKEQKNRSFLKDTFGKYVSPKLIDDMYKNMKVPELGGESGVRTAFFSDLQAFSTISEQLTSKELVDLLNEFLSSQTEIIINHRGTLDKYEGDAILSFFGAPMFFEDHAKAALDTGIYCQKNLDELNEKWKSEGDKWPGIVSSMKMRIGINSGDMVTGNMGSKHHMNYTMMGDVVNIAARLESAAKQYGILFFTTEETLLSADANRYCWRYIDRVQFVGKSVWHQTVEIIDFKNQASKNNLKLVELFNEGLENFYDQNWDDAIEIFDKSKEFELNDSDNDINPSKIFIERAYEFKRFPPRSGWRGAFIMERK
jgi:adenylate cyclase